MTFVGHIGATSYFYKAAYNVMIIFLALFRKAILVFYNLTSIINVNNEGKKLCKKDHKIG